MRTLIRCSTGLAALLLAGAVLASGPANPPPASCAVDEIHKCENIGGQTYCQCAKRDLTATPKRGDDPRRLKGKPQHLVNHGAGAADPAPQQPGKR